MADGDVVISSMVTVAMFSKAGVVGAIEIVGQEGMVGGVGGATMQSDNQPTFN